MSQSASPGTTDWPPTLVSFAPPAPSGGAWASFLAPPAPSGGAWASFLAPPAPSGGAWGDASPTRIKLRNEQGRSFGIIRV